MSRKPLPDNKKSQAVSIRISPDLKQRIDRIAEGEDRSINNMINILLRRAVEQYERGNNS